MSDISVTDKPRQRRMRTRPPSYPEALRAIASTVERPGASLAYPTVTYSRDRLAGYDLNMLVFSPADVLGWVRAMDDVMSIFVQRHRDRAQLLALGVARGVVVDVWMSSVALAERFPEGREITVAELEALASETALTGTAVSS